ncbi:MAG: penicillin-binding protein 1A [Blastocatellia bacterium AA13]|nr:MAG: penicillin-binding protein 1A [Blastocatellia bacterium AA13]
MVTVTKRPVTQAIKRDIDQRPGFFRRLFTPRKIAAYLILLLICVSVFTFFYFKYSRMIDARLRGDVKVRTTGLFAAPRPVHVGQPLSLTAIRSYLDGIGYVDSTREADSKRGRYQIKGNAIEIHSSGDAVIDGARQFPNVVLSFGASGKGITRIADLDTKRNYDSILLEPEMMTAISNEKRQKQKLVSFKDLPKDYVNAVLAIEDRQFFEHRGINIRGLVRALYRDVGEGEVQEGGSSITQQLVKNFFLTPERTLKRKLQEMMIALVLETKLSKQEIFQLYANEVYMGQSGSYSINGVGEAASTYFNKDVLNLTLPESAFLAGIIRGPSLYSPYREPERARSRRNQVLDSMVASELISRELGEQAKAAPLNIQPKKNAMNVGAPYFVDYLQQQMSTEMAGRDLANQSYRVYTTIDMELQRAADKAVNDTLAQLDKIFAKRRKNPVPPGTLQASLVAMNPKTGELLAMVGGRDYGQSQLNRAVDAHRQPGSVFKPIVYAAALNTAYEESSDEVITPASVFMDAPETFYYGKGETYSPDNFGKVYSNQNVSMREGLVHSLNVVTVRVAEKVGYTKVVRLAEKLGLSRPLPYPATALGTAEATPLEVARAYTALCNGGILTEPRAVVRVANSTGLAVSKTAPSSRPALKPQISWLMTNILQDVLDHGTGARARSMGFTATAAGKTGTSRDGWFAGYTPNLVCVVWVGFDDNSELGLEGAKSALPIWTSFMKQALAVRPDLSGDSFSKPDGITEAEIDPQTGQLATTACSSHRTEYFIEGSQPTEMCKMHSGDQPGSPLNPGFHWPEDLLDLPDKPKQGTHDGDVPLVDSGHDTQKRNRNSNSKQ